MRVLFVVVAWMAGVRGGAVELSSIESFKELAVDSGKSAFVKFWAPWCGHCKAMKPAWEQLGNEYKDSSSVLIGGADCTSTAKELCEHHEVRGYPTIKYWTAETGLSGQDYQGGRDIEALKKFVADTLEVKCLKDAPEGCNDKEKDFLEKWKGKPSEEIAGQKSRLEGMQGSSMKPELKKWLHQRLSILKQL